MLDPRCMIRVGGSQETNPGLSHNRLGVISRKIWPLGRDRAKIMLLTWFSMRTPVENGRKDRVGAFPTPQSIQLGGTLPV